MQPVAELRQLRGSKVPPAAMTAAAPSSAIVCVVVLLRSLRVLRRSLWVLQRECCGVWTSSSCVALLCAAAVANEGGGVHCKTTISSNSLQASAADLAS